MQRVASIPAIVDQHVDDAAFLWLRRRNEIDGPLLDEVDIGRIDQRLDANLEGLEAAGEAGWKTAKARLQDYAEPGEMFVVGWLALRSGDDTALTEALDCCASMGEPGVSALSGAVARVERDVLRPHVSEWLHSRSAALRSLGLAALAHHRVDPGGQLGDLLHDPDAQVRSRAMRLAGRMKLRDHVREIAVGLEGESPRERLVAATALCLLGETRTVLPVFDRLALGEGAIVRDAMEMRLLVTPVAEAKRWLQSRLEQPLMRVDATALIGLLRDRTVMPWLIDNMRDPERVAAAGEALRDLFEIDFSDTDLFTSDTASLGADFGALDEAMLPVADRVEAWWDQGRGGQGHRVFRSMRWHRLEALRKALAEPDLLPANWRKTRAFPAWM